VCTLIEGSSPCFSMSKIVDRLTDSIRAAVGTSYMSRGAISDTDHGFRVSDRRTGHEIRGTRQHRQVGEYPDDRP
jgi:hypothetical protein